MNLMEYQLDDIRRLIKDYVRGNYEGELRQPVLLNKRDGVSTAAERQALIDFVESVVEIVLEQEMKRAIKEWRKGLWSLSEPKTDAQHPDPLAG